MKNTLLIASLFVATAGAVYSLPHTRSKPPINPTPVVQPLPPIAPPSQNERPRVEAVFVLDTTGSMSGLIQGAKENIWSIARSMASARPTPDLHVGLIGFRDRGDEYVTRLTDLSTDLDSTYAKLMDFEAGGGGDTPESVNQALHEAVTKISWSQDKNAYKVIFLVGDAPPHTDYQDDVPYEASIKLASEKGIVVNTIQAGSDPNTAREWKRIAMLSQGNSLHVAQSGGAVEVATPFDEALASLSKELDDTRLFYGDREDKAKMAAKQAATSKLHDGGSLASRAKRAAFNASAAGEANLYAGKDLVDAVSKGDVELEALPAAALPEPMQAMAPEAQKQLIAETAERRNEIQTKIQDLVAKRESYIAKEVVGRADADSFDRQIYDTVRDQAEKKGLKYEEGPKF
ncbi:vWA domain-containing protein [Pseudomarimonas arenosa]|uniref:VWA domain-containing protein n=1 Tax=Pseudomarimonas arenosa TaxID=2774145 RepID=A0AAW3ZNQ8_9GAMM|nr:vWA domain-containing protein [Pseudomarimonas arenosa]MBD8527808.1 VWA domain-containing protein [Pseudomarimonas arenosa]